VLGIGSVLSLYITARMMNMYMTSQVFQAGLTAALVALVIIFQEDIRMAMEKLATIGDFRSKRRLLPSNKTVDAIVDAVCKLATDKIGALIVIKGEESLDRHLTGGIPLNGRISVPLLYSIFHPETPNHDGAVIIEGDRIDKFGVRLPLTHNLAETRDTGTRHSAAVGLAERSDALVLVVSEERGTKSVAENGHMETVSQEMLRNRLNDYYNRLFPPPAKLSHFSRITKNYGLKLTSIICSIILYSLVAYRVDTVNRTYTVPIEYRNVPQGFVLENPQPQDLKVTLSGPERLFAFDNSILVASLDLGKIHIGNQSIPITEKHINIPKGLSVNSISPNEFSFRASKTELIDVPVRVKTRGKLSKTLQLDEIKATPGAIQLLIPQSKKGSLTEVPTEELDLDQISQSTIVRLRVIPPYGLLPPDENQNSVKVTVNVSPKQTSEKTIINTKNKATRDSQ
jgi:uncharacterized protein (TIGR00159 family)